MYQVKLAIQAHTKRAQEVQYRASAHTQTNYIERLAALSTTDKSVQANHEPKSIDRPGLSKLTIYFYLKPD